jgi:ATP-binding cassette subfamily G (WHITE) protein 2
LTGYVAQDDILMGSMTPKEALMFAAELKLPREMSREEKKKRVCSFSQQIIISFYQSSIFC